MNTAIQDWMKENMTINCPTNHARISESACRTMRLRSKRCEFIRCGDWIDTIECDKTCKHYREDDMSEKHIYGSSTFYRAKVKSIKKQLRNDEIEQRYLSGDDPNDIADHYGLDDTTVRNILTSRGVYKPQWKISEDHTPKKWIVKCPICEEYYYTSSRRRSLRGCPKPECAREWGLIEAERERKYHQDYKHRRAANV